MGYDWLYHCSGPPAWGRCKKKTKPQALGRSAGRLSTKIHAACDALGNPIRFILSPGQDSDYSQALTLIDGLDMGFLLADKGYDSDYIVDCVGRDKAVIPPRSMRKNPRVYDKSLYKERSLIERLFNKLKGWRRIATRYDKSISAYLAFIHLASIIIWLK
jgi:transposase